MKNKQSIMNIFFVMLCCLFILTGCDNNKGPFSIHKEDGENILYSGDNPAKGVVKKTVTNNDGTKVVVSEIKYNKGEPAGNFKLYDTNGVLLYNSKGKWVSNPNFSTDVFKGKIEGLAYSGAGIFAINKDYLLYFDGDYSSSFLEDTLYDGVVKANEYDTVFRKKDGKFNGMNSLQYTAGGTTKTEYDNGVLKSKFVLGRNNYSFHWYDGDKTRNVKVDYSNNVLLDETLIGDQVIGRCFTTCTSSHDGKIHACKNGTYDSDGLFTGFSMIYPTAENNNDGIGEAYFYTKTDFFFIMYSADDHQISALKTTINNNTQNIFIVKNNNKYTVLEINTSDEGNTDNIYNISVEEYNKLKYENTEEIKKFVISPTHPYKKEAEEMLNKYFSERKNKDTPPQKNFDKYINLFRR